MGASSRRRCFSWAPRWEGLSPKNVVQGLAAWVAVLTTMAGALGAHIEAARFDQLAIGYRATAARLEALRDEWNDRLSREPPVKHKRTTS
ncbi:MAG: hypothetical protein ACREUD_07450 [Gammaproteobacteria bacterium]